MTMVKVSFNRGPSDSNQIVSFEKVVGAKSKREKKVAKANDESGQVLDKSGGSAAALEGFSESSFKKAKIF